MTADALPQVLDGACQERAHVPQTLTAADIAEEVAKDLPSKGSVADLRMELHAIDGPAAVPHCCERTGIGLGEGKEITADRHDLVAVTHPDDHVFGQTAEKAVGVSDVAVSTTELTAGPRLDIAAEHLAGELHAVADAE